MASELRPLTSDLQSQSPSAGKSPDKANIAALLSDQARQRPQQAAILDPVGRGFRPIQYRTTSFAELDQLSDRLAAKMIRRGVTPGTRLVLFVPFSTEFIAWTYALLKAGATVVLIDPGMGRNNIFRCLAEIEPDGFVAIRRVQWIRRFLKRRFPHARLNVAVNRLDVQQTLAAAHKPPIDFPNVVAGDPAAVIFTSGSTGRPKGVLYEHGMFAAQVALIQNFYGVEPGEIDLPGFPLFGLFNAAMGVTTVIPQMNPLRPAKVNPRRIIAAIEQQQVTQAFGSPAFWNRVGRYCDAREQRIPGLKRAMSAGGPVPVHVVERMSRALTGPGADLFTPYGATECLPVSSIAAGEVLERTAALTGTGAGTCVGRPFPNVEIAIIAANDVPLRSIDEAQRLTPGEIGEIIVRSPSATREYYRRSESTALAKIPDRSGAAAGRPDFWHRMGDVGYFDDAGRLWFCGRKAHIVQTAAGPMYSVCCEGIFDAHPLVYRTALVGVGDRPRQRPILIVEPEPRTPRSARSTLKADLLMLALSHRITKSIRTILLHPSLPVDTRHNVKINREALAQWAAAKLAR